MLNRANYEAVSFSLLLRSRHTLTWLYLQVVMWSPVPNTILISLPKKGVRRRHLAAVSGTLVSPVEGDADQLLSPLPVELDDKEAGAELGQALPRLDEVHLGLDQVEVLDVGVCLKDLLSQL